MLMLNLDFLRKHSIKVVLSYDISAIIFSWWIAFFIRYDFSEKSLKILEHGFNIQCLIIATHTFFYWYYKTYRPLWRFFSIPELTRLSKAVFLAWIGNIVILFSLHDLVQIPKSIWFIYPLWLVLMLGLGRLVIRTVRDKQVVSEKTTRILMIGAGKGADLFLRELSHWRENKYRVVASLDDDMGLKGKEIRGVPILGEINNLSKIAQKEKIDLIVIAIPSIQTAALRRILTLCEQISIAVKILPSLSEIADNHITSMQPREVSLEDLLGRDPVQLNWHALQSFLFNQVVLVSGGGGSIGSELCQQILKLNPKELIVVDHSEFNLYQIEKKLMRQNVVIKLLNITDQKAVERVMQQYQPSVVFHAAAYKHVPILETQVFEAVKNNILGTKKLVEAAIENKVSKFIMVSTDKAVNPTNIMGATKRVAELFCQIFNSISNTQFITVRFGNVIGSAGSVIPLFKEQIQNGGPITITHPEMTRYFMTIKEAAQLILQSGAQGVGGEIFVLDMGKPMKITALAKHLIQLSGKKPNEIEIVYTGLRPGEKLFEELFYRSEILMNTNQEKIFKANSQSNINYQDMNQAMILLEEYCLQHDEDALVQILKNILKASHEA